MAYGPSACIFTLKLLALLNIFCGHDNTFFSKFVPKKSGGKNIVLHLPPCCGCAPCPSDSYAPEYMYLYILCISTNTRYYIVNDFSYLLFQFALFFPFFFAQSGLFVTVALLLNTRSCIVFIHQLTNSI